MRRTLTVWLIAALLLTPLRVAAQSGTIAPVPWPPALNAVGAVCANCHLWVYESGTTTEATVYQNATLTTAHPNPIVLNAAGLPPAPIFLDAESYKFVLTSSLDATIRTADNITAIQAAVTGVTNTGDVVFQADSDNDGTNVFSFLSGTGIQKAAITESGDLQIDGSLTVGDATEADKAVIFDGNVQDYHIGLDDSADTLVIGRGTALGTTTSASVSTSGQITFNTDLLFTDASFDIGKTGATRPRDFFLSRNATIGGTLGVTGASSVAALSATTGVFTGAITATGGSLVFPATQVPVADVNTLDDYEEGSWTPVIGGSGGTSGQVYSVQVGRYVKIGKLVTASFAATLSTLGTVTTNVQIQGLPFAAESLADLDPPTALRYAALSTNWVNVIATVQNNTTTAAVSGAAAAAVANTTNLITTDLSATTSLKGVLIYRAAN